MAPDVAHDDVRQVAGAVISSPKFYQPNAQVFVLLFYGCETS